jgi:hypothetical protein
VPRIVKSLSSAAPTAASDIPARRALEVFAGHAATPLARSTLESCVHGLPIATMPSNLGVAVNAEALKALRVFRHERR